ncbi:MAG: demethoxyubiquinone hydroxylase family protein [Allosphingosinicella sp.]
MAEPQTTETGGVTASQTPSPRAPSWRPGDDRPDLAAMIRVDQAGEYGATRIYCGQLAVLGTQQPAAGLVARMQSQEQRHLRTFDAMMVERGVRPTLLQPVWHVAGYALGAATALMSPGAAMACTAAVETEIDRHYGRQVSALGGEEPDLSATISRFQAEELEHRDTALAEGAEQTFGYPLLSGAIRIGCRLAIALSKRI